MISDMAITDMTDPRDDQSGSDDDTSNNTGAGTPAAPGIPSPYGPNNPPPANPNNPAPGATGPGSATTAGNDPNHPLNQLTAMMNAAGARQGSDGDGRDEVLSYLTNYNERYGGATPALFRDEVVEQMISVLISKNKPNPLLVGAAGVGKTLIVEELARRIVAGEIPDQLTGYTVYELPASAMVSGASLVGQLEERVEKILAFAADPDNRAILFIDEIHQLTGSGAGESTMGKIAQILKPALARGDVHVIGATTSQEARTLDNDPAFKRRFSQLIVSELSVEQTATVLKHVLPSYIDHYRGVVHVDDDQVIDAIVSYADEYNRARNHRPDNALTLLDKTMAQAALTYQKMVEQGIAVPPHIQVKATLAESTALQLMTGHITTTRTDYEQLADNLAQIKGQDHVTDQVIRRVRALELGVFPQRVPATWLFAGASGVGKTRVAEIVAETLTRAKPIILNMAEYHEAPSINRLIGSAAGYVGSESNKEKPLDPLESNPRQVIVLDEFEKAHRDVQNLFLAAFDKGYIDTAAGKVIDLSKAIVVATTNAGRDTIGSTRLGFNSAEASTAATMTPDEIAHAFGTAFPKELVARFSYVTAFNRITREVYTQALTEHYGREYDRISDTRPRFAQYLPETLDADTVEELVESSWVPAHGIRPARRAVETWINDRVLDAI